MSATTEPSTDGESWRDRVLRGIHRAAIDVEGTVDVAWQRLSQKLGLDRPRWVAAYRGFSDHDSVWLRGRVLANRPLGGPGDDDRWWENLLATYQRFASRELGGIPVRLRVDGQELELETDEEGYYAVERPWDELPAEGPMWRDAAAEVEMPGERAVVGVHKILQPSASARFGVISDIDDTVLETSITSLLAAAKLTFLHNARTRKPLAGVAALYRALQTGKAAAEPAPETAAMAEDECLQPIFYVSSSAWNLYDLLDDFMRLNGIPEGPILLRDLGVDETKLLKEKGHGHKLEKAKRILDAFPELPFVLIGDSGQEDAVLYAQAAEEYGDRIRAIYIRDVDAGHAAEAGEQGLPSARGLASAQGRATRVDDARARAEAVGVPMLLARDSSAMARHAAELDLLPAEAIPEIDAEVERDAKRPEVF